MAASQNPTLPLAGLDDPEGDRVPANLPPVIDAHVHFFPDNLFDAVWGWFDQFGWPIRYRLYTDALIDFLLARGIRHIVALQYAHKAGLADGLNRYMAGIVRNNAHITGLATVFPGERHARKILVDAFNNGLRGIKLHSHVQCFEMDSFGMHEVYRCCSDFDLPLVIHAGREPKSPAYACDPHKICHWTHVQKVLGAYPDLKLVVPHLGADEFDAYRRLLDQFDHLWLDTTMVLADYLPMPNPPDLASMPADRLLFGTDFPNIPYAWDRELRQLQRYGLDAPALRKILAENAMALFRIEMGAPRRSDFKTSDRAREQGAV